MNVFDFEKDKELSEYLEGTPRAYLYKTAPKMSAAPIREASFLLEAALEELGEITISYKDVAGHRNPNITMVYDKENETLTVKKWK